MLGFNSRDVVALLDRDFLPFEFDLTTFFSGIGKDVAPFSSLGGILYKHIHRYTFLTGSGSCFGQPDLAAEVRVTPHALKTIGQQKGIHPVKKEYIKEDGRQLRRNSLNELISGNDAKYRQPLGISWLNVRRLFDFRRWRYLRMKFFLLGKGIIEFQRRILKTFFRQNRKGTSGSGARTV